MTPSTDGLATLIEAHLTGLEAVAAGGPTAEEIAAAPELSRWHFVDRDGVPALRGHAPGHPLLRGQDIVTSRLLYWNPRRTYARTQSRWYRLGTSADPAEATIGGATDRRLTRALSARIDEVEAGLRRVIDGYPHRLLGAAEGIERPDLAARLRAVIREWPGAGH